MTPSPARRRSIAAMLPLAFATSLGLTPPASGQGGPKPSDTPAALLKPPPDEAPGQDGAPSNYVHSLDDSIALFERRVDSKPSDANSWRYLGEFYEQKAEETGRLEWYAKAEQALRTSLKQLPNNDRARTSLAAALCSRHKFGEGLEVIRDVAKRRPEEPDVLAILGDALLESGKYPEAQAVYESLMKRAPVPAVLSRVANLRDQQGRTDEAIALMKRAVEATRSAGSEKDVAWFTGRLAEITLLSGRIDEADALYRSIPKGVDAYHDATFALGRIQEGRGEIAGAIKSYRAAIEIGPDPHMLIALAELERRGDKTDVAKALEDRFRKITAESPEYRRDLASFLVNSGNERGRGLELAEFDYRERKDIFGTDTVAWARYRNGKIAEAREAIDLALRVGTKDASIAAHAGLICLAGSDEKNARIHLESAEKRMALLAPGLRDEVKVALETLRSISDGRRPR